jgi:hypothetical protein
MISLGALCRSRQVRGFTTGSYISTQNRIANEADRPGLSSCGRQARQWLCVEALEAVFGVEGPGRLFENWWNHTGRRKVVSVDAKVENCAA